MENHHIKAVDLLTESIKLIVTIATILFGGLLAYGANLTQITNPFSFYGGLSLLAMSSILSVININSLINKVNRNEDDAIKNGTVKTINVLASLSLLFGIAAGAYFLLNSPPSKGLAIAPSQNTRITNSEIIIGTSDEAVIKVEKNQNGDITVVDITQKNK